MVLVYTEGSDNWLRAKACEVLGVIGTEKSLPTMEKLAKEQDQMVSGQAQKAADSIKVRLKLGAPKN